MKVIKKARSVFQAPLCMTSQPIILNICEPQGTKWSEGGAYTQLVIRCCQIRFEFHKKRIKGA